MRFRHRGVRETRCRNTSPHPTHPARHPRHESDGRVAQGPDAASRDQKTNHNPHRHETPPIGPHSHQRPPHTPFAALHVYNGQYKDHPQFQQGAVARHHLNLSEPQRTPNHGGDDDGLVISSTRLDVVVQQAPCVRDVLPIVSGRCRATIRARRATTSSQRSRCPSTRSRLVSARRPSRVATMTNSQWHLPRHHHSPSLGRPPELSTARVA